eukprot:7490768-Alexandrium_andersonii.AAC.1
MQVLKATMADRGVAERRLLQRIMMHGLWSASRVAHLGGGCADCEWCGAPREDTMHRLWSCPRFEGARAAVLAEHDALVRGVPCVAALVGLPPKMVVSLQGAGLWAQQDPLETQCWPLPSNAVVTALCDATRTTPQQFEAEGYTL